MNTDISGQLRPDVAGHGEAGGIRASLMALPQSAEDPRFGGPGFQGLSRRVALKGTELAEATCATIRSKLIKIGAVVVRKLTIVRLHLSSHYRCKTCSSGPSPPSCHGGAAVVPTATSVHGGRDDRRYLVLSGAGFARGFGFELLPSIIYCALAHGLQIRSVGEGRESWAAVSAETTLPIEVHQIRREAAGKTSEEAVTRAARTCGPPRLL